MACALRIGSLAWVSHALSAVDGLVVDNGLAGCDEYSWAGAAIDSRAECSGRLFFALKGENTDGHLFARDAFGAGCVAVVIEDKELSGSLSGEGIPCLLVSDCLVALQQLARFYRRGLDVRVVAITGSTGKTSTKEQIRQILRSKFRVFANPGNYNNLIGVPLTILETEIHNEYLVCEVGANQLGEIRFLGEILSPDIGVITNVGDAHIGVFGSAENIVYAKGELLDRLDEGGCAVLPRDSDYFEQLRERAHSKVISFGLSPEADYRVTDIKSTPDGLAFAVNTQALKLKTVSEYNALNACAAFAVGEFCGVDPARIREALAQIIPMPGRGKIHRAGGVTLIDESYNASPAGMGTSLDALGRLDAGRRLAVLGDMKELGDYSRRKHEELGEQIAQKGIDRVFWFGQNGGAVEEGIKRSGAKIPFYVFTDIEALTERVEEETAPGDVILVKASRACNLDQFVASFLGRFEQSTET